MISEVFGFEELSFDRDHNGEIEVLWCGRSVKLVNANDSVAIAITWRF